MKKQNTLFLMNKELSKMYDRGKGRSKKTDKEYNRELRSEARENGMSYKDSLYINALENYIYSESTFQNYKKHCRLFCQYLSDRGLKKITLEESRNYIQDYVKYLDNEKGWSPYSINLALAACVKATHSHMVDFNHPRRSISRISRGTKEAIHDAYNEKKYSKSIEADKILGLRRKSLEILRVRDIKIVDTPDGKVAELSVKGKGGKINHQLYIAPEEVEYIKGLVAGRQLDERLFSKDEISPDYDYHTCRKEHAQDVYKRACEEVKNNPGRRDWYKSEVERIFARDGKKLREDLDKPIYLRGEHKQFAIENGLPTQFDRTLVMYVSTTCLSHTRTDVSVQNYLCKL